MTYSTNIGKRSQFLLSFLFTASILFFISDLQGQVKSIVLGKPGDVFKSSIKSDNLDTTVYAEWVDGTEKRIRSKDIRQENPQWLIHTDKTEPGHNGISYGVSKKVGPRYLRIGLLTSISVGTIMTDGGGRPSVLKAGVTYPGNLNDDANWIPAQRIVNGQLSDQESARGEYALWVLPVGTKTRAIRFTHKPMAADESYEGYLGGAVVTEERYINIAQQAVASAKSNTHQANLIINGINDNWASWANRDEREAPLPGTLVISKTNDEWILLSWPQPVKLTGLVALWAGFGSAEIQTYTGPVAQHARDANESQWQTIAEYSGVQTQIGHFWPNLFDFGKEIATNAIRIKIIAALKNEGTHIKNKMQDGKRAWVGEIIALQSLNGLPLKPYRISTADDQQVKAPIAVPFTLKEAGYVTLVIEDKDGIRVRNLIAETWFNAGKNIAWWDGLDDLGRDIEASRHGIYKIPSKLVVPGEYKVRGLVHSEVNTIYEFPVYSTGNPVWSTDDHKGGWLANHSAPQAALFVPAKQSPTGQPAIVLGSYVTEGPDGLAWVDLEGNKLGGKKWIGGTWTAAPFMARDAGEKADATVYNYVGSVWTGKSRDELELRITGLTASADKPVILHPLGARVPKDADVGLEMGGLAVHDGIAVVSLTKKNQLLFVDVKTGKVLGTAVIDAPQGLAFDSKGSLFVLSSTKLLKYKSIENVAQLPAPQTVISSGLEAPIAITINTNGGIFISDRGGSHQVKVFTAAGKFVTAIGKNGKPKAGPYDELHMNNPAGITIDAKQQLWVTENDYLPKRVSVWSVDGKLIKAFYGPSKYGGGGSLDPKDKTKFYYGEESHGSMEFKLDWKTGDSKLQSVIYRMDEGSTALGFRSAGPETALYYNGKRYFTNCYNTNPTSGHTLAYLFADRNGIAYPIAAMGRADNWDVLKEDQFKAQLPPGIDLKGKGAQSLAFFIWTDANQDGKVQPNEVVFQKGAPTGITVMDDLSFCVANFEGNAIQYVPVSFDAQGTPVYKLDQGKILAKGTLLSGSSGGNQVLASPDGYMIATNGIQPFERYSISGAKDGKPLWSYPNLWPGLHASHEAPLPGFPGQLVGPTRLLGGLFQLKGSDAGPLWAVNSNHGMIYIFTNDGLFVTTLFEPMRTGKRWKMPAAERGMNLKGLTLGEENFWPTITKTADDEVYVIDGARSSLVRVDGLKSIQRLPLSNLTVTKEDLEKSRVFQVKNEALRQKNEGVGLLKVLIKEQPMVVDGKFDDWAGSEWVDIDKSGVKANFNSNSKPYDVTGAITVSKERLYVGYRTGDADLLKNTGEMALAPFKTGGTLDLMIGADPQASIERQSPVAGDLRMLVTVIGGKPRALLYKAVVIGTKTADKVPFSSPWRTIYFDKVEDITSQIEFSASKSGDYELSVPFSVLNLKPKSGVVIKGDIGILRGDGAQTISRVYWTNKATGIVSDVPAEAELTPALWGKFEFK